MRIHHLNCATLCPVSSQLVNGHGGLLSPSTMICHCLLIETENNLILIDTGLGTQDICNPADLGQIFCKMIRPQLLIDETAAQQIANLGFDVNDVGHIILTHLDLDHAGGLPDFPKAQVHVSIAEYDSAMVDRSFRGKFRYKPQHWAQNPNWQLHRTAGEQWFGFEAVTALNNKETEVLLIPLSGHSRGHCGVAVKTPERWILHCGDAYFFHSEMAGIEHYCTPGLRLFQRLIENDHKARVKNQERLRELQKKHENELLLFCSHDQTEFLRYKEGTIA